MTVLLPIVTNSDLLGKLLSLTSSESRWTLDTTRCSIYIRQDYGVFPTKIPREGRDEGPSVARSINLSKFSFSKCDQSAVESRVTFICSVISLVGVRISFETKPQSRTTCVIIYHQKRQNPARCTHFPPSHTRFFETRISHLYQYEKYCFVLSAARARPTAKKLKL